MRAKELIMAWYNPRTWGRKRKRKTVRHNPPEVKTPTLSELNKIQKLEVEILATENFTNQEREKFLEAMDILELVLNSGEFRESILSYVGFRETNGHNNRELYKRIMGGRDKFEHGDDSSLRVHIIKYTNYKKNTVGYTYPSTIKTWANFKYHKNFSRADICGNVFHESLHNMGFTHRKRSKRNQTVPYAGGYIARDLANDVLNGRKLTPITV